MAKMTAAQRKKLPSSQFGLPGTRQYPINTASRARTALGRAKTNATPAQRAQIKAAVKRKYPKMQVS